MPGRSAFTVGLTATASIIRGNGSSPRDFDGARRKAAIDAAGIDEVLPLGDIAGRLRHGAIELEVGCDRRFPRHTRRNRQTTMQLLYVVSAAILGSETARRIFHVESIIQDPNVQELIREWEDKGRAKGHAAGRAEEARRLLHKVLAARSFSVTARVRARIDGETDVARLESWIETAVTARAIGDVFRGR
jgi:hypothetical protein